MRAEIEAGARFMQRAGNLRVLPMAVAMLTCGRTNSASAPNQAAPAETSSLVAPSASSPADGVQPRNAPTPPVYSAPSQPQLANQRTLYVVNYAHLDTQWRWTFPLTIAQYLPYTLLKNVEYFERYPHHVFNWTGASRYQMMKEYYPEQWSVLKQWVARGRWFAAGNQWEECDVLVPSSESILRQILYGRQFFKEEFGAESQEFMLPDSFGFPASLPSLLAHAGLRGFSTQKLTWNSAVGIPFHVGRWRGVDGRGVIAALDAGNYGAVHRTPFSTSEAWAQRLDENAKTSGLKVDYVYNGTGDQGGAPHEASMKTLETSLTTKGPVNVVTGPADLMFRHISDAQAEKMASYEGDLLLTEHSAGSITSQAFMKRLNRMNELTADAAERALTLADLLGIHSYPQRELREAWQLVLRGQFHDIIAGTSVPKAYEYSWNDDFVALNRFAYAMTDGVGAIASQLDTRTNGVSVVIYNPLSIERTDLVEMQLPSELERVASVVATDDTGAALPTQVTVDSDGRRRVLFSATVPALGFVVYALRSGTPPGSSELTVGPEYVANQRYRIALDSDGNVAALLDLQANRELFSDRMRFEFLTEFPSDFPAWNMDWVDRKQPPRAVITSKPTFRVIETGPVRSAIQIEREIDGSRFIQTLRLAAGAAGDRVEFLDRIDWRSSECSLKQAFSLRLQHARATYSWELGTQERGVNHSKLYEMPTHGWIDMQDELGTYGVSLLTLAKYGSDRPSETKLRLTLLYTPATADEYREQRFQDWGRHDIAYALVGHVGDWRLAETQWHARRFEQPLRAFAVPKHAGVLGRRFSALSVRGRGVALQAMKRSEDGNAVVLRFQELHGSRARIQVDSAFEIRDAWESNGAETPIARIPIDDGKLTLDFAPYQLRTLRLAIQHGHAPERGDTEQPTAPRSTPVHLNYDVDAMSAHASVSDGMRGGKSGTLPAELVPGELVVGDVTFRLGPASDGMLNAMRADGQTLTLPPNTAELHLLAVSTSEPVRAQLRILNETFPFEVGSWSGLVGQWDNRIFVGSVREPTFSVNNPLHHIEAAGLRTDRIAWHASHLHRQPEGSLPYSNAYLFSYSFPVAAGARAVTLPKHPAILIFAASAVPRGGAVSRHAVALGTEFPDLTRDSEFHARFDEF